MMKKLQIIALGVFLFDQEEASEDKDKKSLVVSELRSETKGSLFESSCWLCAEVSSLQ